MFRDKQEKKVNIFSRWLGSENIGYNLIIVFILILLLCGFLLNRDLQNTKIELESCKSTCSE